MEERKQNMIGVIVIIIIVMIIGLFWLFFSGNSSDIEDGVILTPSEVSADPSSYAGSEIKVEGVVIDRNQGASSFIIMPIDIYISCDRNAYCGEENTHLNVKYEKSIPPLEHDVIVTGNLNKTENDAYILFATNINDKGKI